MIYLPVQYVQRLQVLFGMRARFPVSVSLAVALLAACAKSPSGPSDPSSGKLLQGRTVSAIDGTAAAGISVQVGPAWTVLTDANGYFQAEIGGPGTYTTDATGAAIVERRTMLSGPTTERVRLSLIPASFDLDAFNQLCRTANSRLQRWTTQPSLVIVASVMAFENTPDNMFKATSEQMSDDEVTQLRAHMTEGLSLLTGGTYTNYAAVDVERPASGDRVASERTGKIVVGRYSGVKGFSDVIGYGTWQEQSDGRVTGGSMYLERDFDKNDSRRRLLRIHELGHALGYLHVMTRESVMNPAIGPEPTDFDRAAARVAFQRQPGNVSPDTDPGSVPFGQSLGGGGRWVPRIP
jgi:hypothetical protein